SGEGTMVIDNLKIGTSFSDVTARVVSAPVITTQPQNQTVFAGAIARFEVSAAGSTPLAYQWQLNGTNLDGATGSILSITNVSGVNAGNYLVTVSNSLGFVASDTVTLTVNPPPAAALSVLTYNTHGNMIEDWSTNSLQVRAIGRQMSYLNPDVITFQEIPLTNTYQMANFVKAFLPGYSLATNSGTDGFIRSAIASRYPITRSTKWLDGANLDPFGYTNSNFTRDLFEAQIAVPGFTHPVHIFTTHLKSGSSSSDDAAKRAAEASAISNFFVTSFLNTTNASHPYLLTGDMNEDLNRPSTGGQQPIQRLANSQTGLQLTTPLNPFTSSELTFSIQAANLTKRYDYILPCGLLFSNILSSQVFCTDLLNPTPPALQSDDDKIASDHLPVMIVFGNPDSAPFSLTSILRGNNSVTLNWQSVAGRVYDVQGSTNLIQWNTVAANLTATGTNTAFTTNIFESAEFFRIYRAP
ncbi:MAG: endonuclease/exonuclease/phosphatase family protein, partial [Verrucomicrobiota bacterium]